MLGMQDRLECRCAQPRTDDIIDVDEMRNAEDPPQEVDQLNLVGLLRGVDHIWLNLAHLVDQEQH